MVESGVGGVGVGGSVEKEGTGFKGVKGVERQIGLGCTKRML